MNNFIVYAFHEPGKTCEIHGNQCPFYIGKGLPIRPSRHFYPTSLCKNTFFYRRLNSLLSKGTYPIVRTIAADLTEQESLDIEIKMIALYGRYDIGTGCLCNHTDGGEGLRNRAEDSLDTRILKARPKSAFAREQSRLATVNRMVPIQRIHLVTDAVLQEFPSINSVRLDGYSASGVCNVLSGRRKSHSGYGWKYAKRAVQ